MSFILPIFALLKKGNTMAKIHNLTVDELYAELAISRRNGDGKKKIMLSNDDEGNVKCLVPLVANGTLKE